MQTENLKNTQVVSIRLAPELWAAVRYEVKRSGMKLTTFVEHSIRRELRRRRVPTHRSVKKGRKK